MASTSGPPRRLAAPDCGRYCRGMPWHPVAVHFPVALLCAALVFDLAGLLWQRAQWHRTAWVLLLAGTLGAAAAVLTGNLDAADYRQSAAAEAIQRHEDLGTVTFLLFIVVTLGRLPHMLRPEGEDRRLRLWIGLAAIGVGLLMWTAQQGGELVYDLGVGVRATGIAP